MAMEAETVIANIEKTYLRKLPDIWGLPEIGKFKGETPLAIVGGGSSLKTTLKDLCPQVMVCGSAHDFLVKSGVSPRYCVVLDPDPLTAKYISTPSPTCTYLVASQCDDAVFKALEGYPVATWHCAGIGLKQDEEKIFRSQPRVGGGCTVTLRALSLAILLGFRNHHYFGFDSCVLDGHHAYESEPIGYLIDVRMPGSNRVFFSAGYMVAQATQFQDALRTHGHLFAPTVHGDGLIAEIMKIGEQQCP